MQSWKFLISILVCATTAACEAQPVRNNLGLVRLPDGFSIELYADKLENARSIEVSTSGVVFVSTVRKGDVYALVDETGDGAIDRTVTLATGLTRPNGIAYRNGSLFVSNGSQILRYDGVDDPGTHTAEPVVIASDLPDESWHGWPYMAFGPDDRLYMSIGSPCNICEADPPHGTILSMAPDGSDRRTVAYGIRNSVGFDWHPISGDLWFTDNGSDNLGDDIPSDELNRVSAEGAHFGFPYFHQGDIRETDLAGDRIESDYEAPVVKLGAHVAALGMHFYSGDMLPSRYSNSLFVAEHGSWNRSTKVGYRIVALHFDEQNTLVSSEVFAEGFLQGESAWGRPVDIAALNDGSLLVSDDRAGAVYRISYAAPKH